MKINIKEKFELIERLEKLSEAITDHAEASNICARALHEFKKGINPGLFSSFVNTLNAYSWINEVDTFINEYSKFVNENRLGLKLEAILGSLEASNHKATYEAAITSLSEIVPMNEGDIKKELHKLKSFSYIPVLRSFLEGYEKQAFAVTKTFKAEVEKSHISPVQITESGYAFHLNGKVYEVDAKITKIEEFKGAISSEFNYAMKALSIFKVEEGNTFILETRNGFIKIIAEEEGNKFFIGENEFVGKESIKTALNTTRVVDYFDTKTKAVIDFMYENAGKYATIEIVKNIKAVTEGALLSFIKLSNNKVFLNKVNKFEKKNEMIEVTGDNYDEIAESFAKELKLDIVPVLESIKVNLKSIEFAKKVKEMEVSSILEDSQILFTQIKEAKEFYATLNEGEKSDCAETVIALDKITALVESEKIKFLLESIAKFKAEEVEGKEEILELLKTELVEAINVTYKVGDNVLVKDVISKGVDKVGIIKEIPKSSDQYNIEFDGEIYGIMPNRIIKKV
jgi:hypothetical protein